MGGSPLNVHTSPPLPHMAPGRGHTIGMRGCLFEALVDALGQIWCTHFGHKAFHECCTLCMYVCMYDCRRTHIHTCIRLWKVQKPASLTGKTGELRNGCFIHLLVEELEKIRCTYFGHKAFHRCWRLLTTLQHCVDYFPCYLGCNIYIQVCVCVCACVCVCV